MAVTIEDIRPIVMEYALEMENELRKNEAKHKLWVSAEDTESHYNFLFMDSRKMFSHLQDAVDTMDSESSLMVGLGAEQWSKRCILQSATWIAILAFKYKAKAFELADDIWQTRTAMFRKEITSDDPEYIAWRESL